jgi:hypothetical protein
VGYATSITLDSFDNPHITYTAARPWVGDEDNLKYAYWTGENWNIQTVDSEGDVGEYPSIALQNNNPHISYYDSTNGNLKYAYWTGENWNIQTVDSEGDVGKYTSIAIDALGNIYISYYDGTNGDLKCAKFLSGATRTESQEFLDLLLLTLVIASVAGAFVFLLRKRSCYSKYNPT